MITAKLYTSEPSTGTSY